AFFKTRASRKRMSSSSSTTRIRIAGAACSASKPIVLFCAGRFLARPNGAYSTRCAATVRSGPNPPAPFPWKEGGAYLGGDLMKSRLGNQDHAGLRHPLPSKGRGPGG